MLAFHVFIFLLAPQIQVGLPFIGLTIGQNESDALWQLVTQNNTPATGCNLGNGTRVLITIASYGTKQRGLLVEALRGMEGIAPHVSQLDIVLLLTIPLNFSASHKNLHVHTHIFPPTIGFHLVSQFRPFMVASLLQSLHDIYITMEDDLAFRFSHLQALCSDADVLQGTDYFPGFLRYETLSKQDPAQLFKDSSRIFLSDYYYHATPRITKVFRIAGREFVQPQRPYQAMVVLPVGHYVLLKMGRNTIFQFLTGASTIREYYTTFWVHNQYLVKVVPLDSLQQYLIHHMSNKYLLASKDVLAKKGVSSPTQLKKLLKEKPLPLKKVHILPLLSDFLAGVQICNATQQPTIIPLPNPQQYFSKLPRG
eukprot:GGOE01045587.1.p1 GENE.GGOE01045587.1~~GGOE01045587.1.p1  ORF type:complete len:367 (+),score=77.47 GGOE01045587.1:109-1209(+)